MSDEERERDKRYENLLRETGVLADPPTREIKLDPDYTIMAGYIPKLEGMPYAATVIEVRCPCGREECSGTALVALGQGLN
jgi:hypothetical protein